MFNFSLVQEIFYRQTINLTNNLVIKTSIQFQCCASNSSLINLIEQWNYYIVIDSNPSLKHSLNLVKVYVNLIFILLISVTLPSFTAEQTTTARQSKWPETTRRWSVAVSWIVTAN